MEMETETIPDNLQGLKRNKLQSLCKKYGVPANLKNIELIQRLEEIKDGQRTALAEVSSSNSPEELLQATKEVDPSDDITNEEPTVPETTHDIPEEHDVTAPKHRGRKPKTSSKSKKRGKRKSPSVDDAPAVAMKTTECSNSDVCSRPEENFSGDHGNKVAVLPSTPVITPAMSIMSDDQVTSSSRKRRKHWSDLQHNESIDEMMERLANTPPIVTGGDDAAMETGGEEYVTNDCMASGTRVVTPSEMEEQGGEDEPPKKRIRRATFELDEPTLPSQSVTTGIHGDDEHSNITSPHTGGSHSSNRSSLSNQFKKSKLVTPNNSIQRSSSCHTLSPLVTSSQSSSSSTEDEDQEVTIKPIPAMMMVDDNDNQRMKEMNAILEDRVNLRKSAGGELSSSSTRAAHRHTKQHRHTTHTSKIPLPSSNTTGGKTGNKNFVKKFDKIHQKNFNRSQSILDFHNRKQQQLSSVTPSKNNPSTNPSTTGKKTGGHYQFATSEQRKQQTTKSGLFKFDADQTDSGEINKMRVQRRKSYNATGSAKKKPSYKPYTGKIQPLKPISNY